jgi:hypothetical protein
MTPALLTRMPVASGGDPFAQSRESLLDAVSTLLKAGLRHHPQLAETGLIGDHDLTT